MATVKEKLYELITPVVVGLGYELVGVEYLAQGKHSLLRVYIDTEGGITLEHCEQVSRQLSALFDVEDPLNGQYNLEVSSPGLERPLFIKEHYVRFSGSRIFVRLAIPLNGRRKFEGLLTGVEDDEVVLKIDDEVFNLPLIQIEKAHIVPEFS